ncbi:MAG: hypothetical protein RIQ88_1061 [Actinomycetota bacterium]
MIERPWNPKPSKRGVIIALCLVLVIAAGVGYLGNKEAVRNFLDQYNGNEYSGSGSQTIDFHVYKGDTGVEIAKALVAQDVTKDYETTLRHIFSANPTFFPGTYRMPTQISSDKAIQILVDPTQVVVNRVLVQEGLRLSVTFKKLSNATGISVSNFESAAKNISSFDLPKEAPSLEGYLFPATYDFQPDLTAKQILSLMVERTKEQLRNDGVAQKDWHKTLTLASVIQMEARLPQDFYKVSRTFKNRLAIGMHLQSDATVSYGVQGSTVSTSSADRANNNGYNTYLYAGLPVGPIAGSGAQAIDAALHPAEGKWLYFCTINLKTGETVFSETYADHQKAVALWREWMKQNPGWND